MPAADRLRRAALVALALSTTSSTAGAAITLGFDKREATVGERVQAYVSDPHDSPVGFFNGPVHGIRVYLVPLAFADRIGGPHRDGTVRRGPPPRRHLTLVGFLRNVRHVGRIAFTVPRLPPGRYTTVIWCRPCLPPKGSVFSSALYPHGSATPDDPTDVKVLRVRGTRPAHARPGATSACSPSERGSRGSSGRTTR